MTIATGLILARFLHILAASVLFGAALFPFYGLPNTNPAPSQRLPWLQRLLSGCGLVSVVSAFAWVGFMAAEPGRSLSAVVYNTNFGWVWPLRLLLGSMLVV